MELGRFGIRVNAICLGAVSGARMDGVIAREDAARQVSADTLYQSYANCISLKHFITAEDIANIAI